MPMLSFIFILDLFSLSPSTPLDTYKELLCINTSYKEDVLISSEKNTLYAFRNPFYINNQNFIIFSVTSFFKAQLFFYCPSLDRQLTNEEKKTYVEFIQFQLNLYRDKKNYAERTLISYYPWLFTSCFFLRKKAHLNIKLLMNLFEKLESLFDQRLLDIALINRSLKEENISLYLTLPHVNASAKNIEYYTQQHIHHLHCLSLKKVHDFHLSTSLLNKIVCQNIPKTPCLTENAPHSLPVITLSFGFDKKVLIAYDHFLSLIFSNSLNYFFNIFEKRSTPLNVSDIFNCFFKQLKTCKPCSIEALIATIMYSFQDNYSQTYMEQSFSLFSYIFSLQEYEDFNILLDEYGSLLTITPLKALGFFFNESSDLVEEKQIEIIINKFLNNTSLQENILKQIKKIYYSKVLTDSFFPPFLKKEIQNDNDISRLLKENINLHKQNKAIDSLKKISYEKRKKSKFYPEPPLKLEDPAQKSENKFIHVNFYKFQMYSFFDHPGRSQTSILDLYKNSKQVLPSSLDRIMNKKSFFLKEKIEYPLEWNDLNNIFSLYFFIWSFPLAAEIQITPIFITNLHHIFITSFNKKEFKLQEEKYLPHKYLYKFYFYAIYHSIHLIENQGCSNELIFLILSLFNEKLLTLFLNSISNNIIKSGCSILQGVLEYEKFYLQSKEEQVFFFCSIQESSGELLYLILHCSTKKAQENLKYLPYPITNLYKTIIEIRKKMVALKKTPHIEEKTTLTTIQIFILKTLLYYLKNIYMPLHEKIIDQLKEIEYSLKPFFEFSHNFMKHMTNIEQANIKELTQQLEHCNDFFINNLKENYRKSFLLLLHILNKENPSFIDIKIQLTQLHVKFNELLQYINDHYQSLNFANIIKIIKKMKVIHSTAEQEGHRTIIKELLYMYNNNELNICPPKIAEQLILDLVLKDFKENHSYIPIIEMLSLDPDDKIWTYYCKKSKSNKKSLIKNWTHQEPYTKKEALTIIQSTLSIIKKYKNKNICSHNTLLLLDTLTELYKEMNKTQQNKRKIYCLYKLYSHYMFIVNQENEKLASLFKSIPFLALSYLDMLLFHIHNMKPVSHYEHMYHKILYSS